VKKAPITLVFTFIFFIGIAGQLFLGGCSKPSESSKPAPARPPVEDQRIASLKQTSEAVLHSIKANDPEVFIGYVSREGVCFGIDCDTESFEQMLKDLNSKSGFYCLLFDTKCERQVVAEMWKASKHNGDITTVSSFHDSLQSARTKKVSYSSGGRVNIEFEEQNGSIASRLSFLELGFVEENGSWKLNAIEYP
jgi:hypothetical protein